jgi:hypothetical protein
MKIVYGVGLHFSSSKQCSSDLVKSKMWSAYDIPCAVRYCIFQNSFCLNFERPWPLYLLLYSVRNIGDTIRRTVNWSHCHIFKGLAFGKDLVKKYLRNNFMVWHTVRCDCRATKMCYNFHLSCSAYMGMCNRCCNLPRTWRSQVVMEGLQKLENSPLLNIF